MQLPVHGKKKQEVLISQQKHNDLVRQLKPEGFSNPAMLDWTFENDNGRSPQMCHAHRYVEQWQTMRAENLGLLLWGGVGTGKTFLAGCIANTLMEQEVPVRMTNFARILNELNGSLSGRNDVVIPCSSLTTSAWSVAPSTHWNRFATFLADVIEKYASVLEIDNAVSSTNNENRQDTVDTAFAA